MLARNAWILAWDASTRVPLEAGSILGWGEGGQQQKTSSQRLSPSLHPDKWRTPLGRPHILWLKTIQQDLKSKKKPLPEWSNRYGVMKQPIWCRIDQSAEINAYVWRYVLLAVHARKEERIHHSDYHSWGLPFLLSKANWDKKVKMLLTRSSTYKNLAKDSAKI